MGRGAGRIKQGWHIKCERRDLFTALWCLASAFCSSLGQDFIATGAGTCWELGAVVPRCHRLLS